MVPVINALFQETSAFGFPNLIEPRTSRCLPAQTFQSPLLQIQMVQLTGTFIFDDFVLLAPDVLDERSETLLRQGRPPLRLEKFSFGFALPSSL